MSRRRTFIAGPPRRAGQGGRFEQTIQLPAVPKAADTGDRPDEDTLIRYAELDPGRTGPDVTIKADRVTAINNTEIAFLQQHSASDALAATGRIYAEFEILKAGPTEGGFDYIEVGVSNELALPGSDFPGENSNSVGIWPDGDITFNGEVVDTHEPWGSGDVIGVAIDTSDGGVWFSVNGVFLGIPESGTFESAEIIANDWFMIITPWNPGTQAKIVTDPCDMRRNVPDGYEPGWPK